MFNRIEEIMTKKTEAQYIAIECKYNILKNYLENLLEREIYSINTRDIELILDSLEPKVNTLVSEGSEDKHE